MSYTPAELLTVYEILVGRKVRDALGVWHVYDAEGNEIADPGGVLLRGIPAALRECSNPVIAEIVQQAGGRTRTHPALPVFAPTPFLWPDNPPVEDDEALLLAVLL